MTPPLVSIIIPTYSRPDNLCRAIDSVLAQTYRPIEIIVVDDNGIGTPFQKETEQKLGKYISESQIIYLKHETNKNGSAARNTGFFASKGDFVGFLDDDDVFALSKIEKQVDKLIKCEGKYDACYCNSIIYNPKRTFRTHNKKEGNLTYDLLTLKVNFNTSTILFRRQALMDIHGWDERFTRHQDWELMVRFFRKHGICIANPELYLVEKFATANVITKDPLRSIKYRRFFLDEIKQDIENLPHPRNVYKAQIEDLSLGLMASGVKKEGRKQFHKIFKYGFPSWIAFVKYFYYFFFK